MSGGSCAVEVDEVGIEVGGLWGKEGGGGGTRSWNGDGRIGGDDIVGTYVPVEDSCIKESGGVANEGAKEHART